MGGVAGGCVLGDGVGVSAGDAEAGGGLPASRCGAGVRALFVRAFGGEILVVERDHVAARWASPSWLRRERSRGRGRSGCGGSSPLLFGFPLRFGQLCRGRRSGRSF